MSIWDLEMTRSSEEMLNRAKNILQFLIRSGADAQTIEERMGAFDPQVAEDARQWILQQPNVRLRQRG